MQRTPSRDLQELWFACRRRNWRTLAIIPAHASGSAKHVAEGLREVAGMTGRAARVVHAEGASLADIATMVMEIQESFTSGSVWSSNTSRSTSEGMGLAMMERTREDELVLLSVESVLVNPLVLALALAADAVLLVAELGVTDIAGAKHTIELIGHERILGTVLLDKR